ncbi:PAP2-domain-containing protein [Clavulina sp. PMI_390]|nr:PAP2-domain-containing protein [Clavulina sp. PMI_390]
MALGAIVDVESLSPFELTHVLYDGSSTKSELAAFITLSPILLMPVYAGIIVKTRELTVINMMLGQLANDVFNHILKYTIKQERPQAGLLGDTYGFPSSHSQYMAYFATFLLLHLSSRHTFASYGAGLRWLDLLQRGALYAGILLWSFGVAFSRYFLHYHTVEQVVAGYMIGIFSGATYFFLTEPARSTSAAAKWRNAFLDSWFAQYWRIRDGWMVYKDGGVEEEYLDWRRRRDATLKVKAE